LIKEMSLLIGVNDVAHEIGAQNSVDAENSYWLWDGVHPTSMGYEMIKREWLKAFEQF